jgi:hypothetical protein
MDSADAVGDCDDSPLIAGVRSQVQALDLAFEQFADFRRVELHL